MRETVDIATDSIRYGRGLALLQQFLQLLLCTHTYTHTHIHTPNIIVVY